MLALPRKRKDGESYDSYMRYLDKCDDQSSVLMAIGIALIFMAAIASVVIGFNT